jgi:hypothetical protein
MAITIGKPKRSFPMTQVTLRPITPDEETDWQEIVDKHHPLGNVNFTGHQIKYVAEYQRQTVALVCFSACAYHLADRDRWIGWSTEQAMQRRHFVVQNSRLLILGDTPAKNLASRVLGLCARRLPQDWLKRFGFEPVLLESFVDPQQRRGTCYKAAGWSKVGSSRGYRRDGKDFYVKTGEVKDIWLKELNPDARELLCRKEMPEPWNSCQKPLPRQQVAARLGGDKLRSLFELFLSVRDPRKPQGRRYSMATCLSLFFCALVAGCKTLRECDEFVANLDQRYLKILKVWQSPKKTKRRVPPKFGTFWRITQLVDADEFERLIMTWCRDQEIDPTAIAVDGKVLRATLNNEDGGNVVVSAFAHEGSPFFSIMK